MTNETRPAMGVQNKLLVGPGSTLKFNQYPEDEIVFCVPDSVSFSLTPDQCRIVIAAIQVELIRHEKRPKPHDPNWDYDRPKMHGVDDW